MESIEINTIMEGAMASSNGFSHDPETGGKVPTAAFVPADVKPLVDMARGPSARGGLHKLKAGHVSRSEIRGSGHGRESDKAHHGSDIAVGAKPAGGRQPIAQKAAAEIKRPVGKLTQSQPK